MNKVIRHFACLAAAEKWVAEAKKKTGVTYGTTYLLGGGRHAGMVSGDFTPEVEAELIDGKKNYAK